MKNKCSFCEEYKTLKSEFDKDHEEDNRYSTKYKVSLRAEFYFNKKHSGSDTFRGHKLNYCPVCGKEFKEREENDR